ncbi:DUF3857 domain-containing protein [Deinococcus sp.]|uniref:DUF3857 domain-containing transglutaminase family protein n=1 Tax=Deinococcus sp. TaxID=47478 RepID=UPI0025E4F0FE|nr:DUF3857 domain-containing protein [Deinococcus sp.]
MSSTRFPTRLTLALILATALNASAQTAAPVPQPTPAPAPQTTPAQSNYSNVPDVGTEHYVVAADASYELVSETTRIIRDQGDLQNGSVISTQFISSLQSAEATEAYVIKADGKKVPVGKTQITIKDAPGAGNYADFGDNKVLQVLFPNVNVGDRLYAKLNIKSRAIFPGRFSYFTENVPFGYPYQTTVTITAPTSLGVKGLARGAVKLEQKAVGDRTEFTMTESNPKFTPGEAGAECPCDYAGAVSINNFAGWDDVARAYRERAADKIAETPELRALATQLVGNKTGLDAVKAIDGWVRENVRYVQVYLDAGGYVPHKASDILNNRYGDCKDYVTLSQALLGVVGIEAEPILVGTMSRYKELPLAGPEQFNHAILYVPSLKIYLDPTNRFAPVGAYQNALAGKPVLHTNAGKLETFPVAPASANLYDQSSSFTLAADGTLSGSMKAATSGTVRSLIRNSFANLTPEQQPQVARSLLDQSGEPGSGSLSLAPTFGDSAAPDFAAEWNSPGAVSIDDVTSLKLPSGISFYIFSRLKSVVSLENRTTPQVVGASELHKAVTLKLPGTLKLLRLPKDAQGESNSFAYKVTYRQEGTQIVADQRLTFKTDIVQPEDYAQFREGMLAAVKATESTILLEKK